MKDNILTAHSTMKLRKFADIAIDKFKKAAAFQPCQICLTALSG